MKVAVLKGGRGLERQVSLRSGARVEDALASLGHEVLAIDVGADLVATLKAERPEVAFVALHGRRRRGRHRPGAARDPADPLHRPRRAGLRALDRQGRRPSTSCARPGSRRLTGPPSTRSPFASSAPPTRWRRSRRTSASRWWSSRPPAALRSASASPPAAEEVPAALARRLLLRRPRPARAPRRGPRAGGLADQRDRPADGRGRAARRGPLHLRGPLRDRAHRVRLPGRSRRRRRPDPRRRHADLGRARLRRLLPRRPDPRRATGPQVLEVNAIPGLTDTSLLPMAAEAAGLGFERALRAAAGAGAGAPAGQRLRFLTLNAASAGVASVPPIPTARTANTCRPRFSLR